MDRKGSNGGPEEVGIYITHKEYHQYLFRHLLEKRCNIYLSYNNRDL